MSKKETPQPLGWEQTGMLFSSLGLIAKREDFQIGWSIAGSVEKEGVKYFFKMAPTPDRSVLIENESSSFKQLRLANDPRFYFPEVYEQGNYKNCAYYVGEFLEGSPTGDEKDHLPADFNPHYVPKMVDLILYFQSLKLDLKTDPAHKNFFDPKKPVKEKLVAAAQRYAKDVKDVPVGTLLETISSTEFLNEYAFATSEVVPWHMFDKDERLAIVDTAAASNFYPLHYDAALSFCRMYTYYPSHPDSPSAFLQAYIDTYLRNNPKTSATVFLDHLRGLIALRTIGQLRDASLKNNHPQRQHYELVGKVTSNQLFT